MSKVIKTSKLNEQIVREMNLQTFKSVKSKDLFVKAVLKHTDLLPCEVDALLAISRYASKVPGVCWATVPTMVADKHTKYGDRAFRKGTAGLREKGIIIVYETRRACSGGKGTNIYVLNPEYITMVSPKSSVQVDDADGVQVGDSYRGEAEIPCGTSDETLSPEAKKSFKESPKNLSKQDNNKSNSNNAVAETESHSENKSLNQEKADSWDILDGRYNEDVAKYCRAYGVPEEVINELKPFVSTNDIITIWKAVRGALRNLNEKYQNNIEEVTLAIQKAVVKFKRGEAKEFGAYIVGTLKGLISDREQRLASEYEERIRQQEREERRKKLAKFYGLDVEDQSESFGGYVYTEIECQQTDSLADRARVLYAEYRNQYQDDSRAFEAVVDALLMTTNMPAWEIRAAVTSAVGFDPVCPEFDWADDLDLAHV